MGAGTPTTQDLAAYLGVDCADDMASANLELALGAAEGYVVGAVGPSVDLSDPRARAVVMAVAADIYDERSFSGASGKAPSAMRRVVSDLCEQLRRETGRRP